MRRTGTLLPYIREMITVILLAHFSTTSATETLNGEHDQKLRRRSLLGTNDPKTVEQKQDFQPKGLRLLFVGDSTMKYQYLSMAYFLHTGQWMDPSNSEILWEGNFGSSEEFFTESTRTLYPHEKCDCFRPAGSQPWEGTENRYFFDPQADNVVAYIQAYGHLSKLQGRLWPCLTLNDILNNRVSTLEEGLNVPLDTIPPRAAVSNEWHESIHFLTSHFFISEKGVGIIERKRPTHVILNSGLWPSDFCSDPNERDTLFNTLRADEMAPIWKTTTYTRSHNFPPSLTCVEETDNKMCDLGGMNGCFDVSWTKNINAQHYYDDFHFSDPNIYRAMNERLLSVTGHLPNEYAFQNIEHLFVQ